jgi:hypothetical protein
MRSAFPTALPAAPESAEPASDEPVAEHRGINIHAKQSVDGRDRRQLERLRRRPSAAKG